MKLGKFEQDEFRNYTIILDSFFIRIFANSNSVYFGDIDNEYIVRLNNSPIIYHYAYPTFWENRK